MFSTIKNILMDTSLSRLGQPVLLNMSIISTARLGFILVSFGDGWSGNKRDAMSVKILFPASSVIIGLSPPSLGRPKTHLTLCSVTRIYLAPICIVISYGSNMSNKQLRKNLSSIFAARRKNPPNPISCIAVCVDCVSVVDMKDPFWLKMETNRINTNVH
jgi:hypothetical protein